MCSFCVFVHIRWIPTLPAQRDVQLKQRDLIKACILNFVFWIPMKMCTQWPKQLSWYLKRNVIGWDNALNSNVQCIILLKWSGMGSDIYCSWGLGPQQLKGALNHAVIKHLGCLLCNIFVPQIIAALKLVPPFVFIGSRSPCEFHCFFYLEMNLKFEVMIKSRRSLHRRNAITTVLRPKSFGGLILQNPYLLTIISRC